MKPWVIWLLAAGVFVCVICGGAGFLGFRAFQNARTMTADADHFADVNAPLIMKDWDISALLRVRADAWKRSQSEAGTREFLSISKSKLGALKSVEPFTTTYSGFRTINHQVVNYATVRAPAVFEKSKGTITMKLIRENNVWKIEGIHVAADVLDGQDYKPTF